MKSYFLKSLEEPYRFFFPQGILFLLAGSLIWLPLLWKEGYYPILIHRYLMLNGFCASFIAGFLMTAVPKFSRTYTAKKREISCFSLATFIGLVLVISDNESYSYLASSFQALCLLAFLFSRIFYRKDNPPYSFLFIFTGLVLWIVSALTSAFTESDVFKHLHYEGAITSIILGVGCRLIPGILGHVEVVQTQRARYETEKPFLQTVPFTFYGLILAFSSSYFITDPIGISARSLIIFFIGIKYWRLYQWPKDQTALTYSLWGTCWLILFSFLLKAFWGSGAIHASHAYFFSGIVLLTLLIATRVLQSHGPKDKNIERKKSLYLISAMVVLAAATRVSAILIPSHYFHHLIYSALVLTLAALFWSYRYLRYVVTQ